MCQVGGGGRREERSEEGGGRRDQRKEEGGGRREERREEGGVRRKEEGGRRERGKGMESKEEHKGRECVSAFSPIH